MKVYLVIDRDENSDNEGGTMFGIFSTREKAEKIMNDLLANFREFGDSEEHNMAIVEFTLDEANDNYHWYMEHV
jgi:hypothetical protein